VDRSGQGFQHGHDQDQAEGDEKKNQALAGMPAHVLTPRRQEGDNGQRPQVREDHQDLVLVGKRFSGPGRGRDVRFDRGHRRRLIPRHAEKVKESLW
jgi:hypothetical protein